MSTARGAAKRYLRVSFGDIIMRYAILALVVLAASLMPVNAQAIGINHADSYAQINAYRMQNGTHSLMPHVALEAAAETKINDMIENNYWGHFSPTDEAPWDLIEEQGYSQLHAGENLAIGFADSKSLVKGWIASTPHRENMLADYEHIGIAYGQAHIGHRHGTLVVAMFASPQPALASIGSNLGQTIRNLLSDLVIIRQFP